MHKPLCVVVGIGPGNGSALARRWASEGYRVVLLGRDQTRLANWEEKIPGSKGIVCDAADPQAVASVYAEVRAELGSVGTLLYNVGSGVWGGLDAVDENALLDALRINAVGLLLAAKQVVPDMRAAGRGTIAVIGAGAAWRGRANTLAFAAAKAAQRSIAQSLARELGPRGIHVFYVVVDGVVDLPRTRALVGKQPDEFFLQPDDIALSVWNVAHQPRSAWSFEIDLRPFVERW